MQHLDEGTIHAWLDGALDAEEASRVEQHVAGCATCAAAVAEARGLVAGASRILSALDDTPSVLAPRSSGGGSTTRRSSSLWNTLRLTPARAAAAAVIVVAAGTALVLRRAPNELEDRAILASAKGHGAPAVMELPPAVDSLRIARAPERTATTAGGAPDTLVVAAPSRALGGVAVSAGRSVTAKTAQESRVAADNKVRDRVTSADTVARSIAKGREDSTRQKAAVSANALEAVVTTSAPSAAPAPAAVGRAFGSAFSNVSSVGCYAVTADSIAGLPQRLSFDTNRVQMSPLMQRAPAAPAARNADIAMRDRRMVSSATTGAMTPMIGAQWERLADGRIRLSIASPARSVDLTPTSNSTLVGSTTVDARVIPVTLQRIECVR